MNAEQPIISRTGDAVPSDLFPSRGFFAVAGRTLWAAVGRSLQASLDGLPADPTRLGISEALLGVLCQRDTPDYTDWRWAPVGPDRGEEPTGPQQRNSSPARPLDHLLHQLAGQLRHLGFTWAEKGLGLWLPLLGVDRATCQYLVHGRHFAEAAADHGHSPTGVEWPAQLRIVEHTRAADLRSAIDTAIYQFRNAPPSLADKIATYHHGTECDNYTDRNVLAELAQLSAIVDALQADDTEVLVGDIFGIQMDSPIHDYNPPSEW
jgi:hypothetical protein